MRVLIAERAHVGHYYTYARYLLQALRGMDVEVVLALTPQGHDSPEFQAHLAEASRGVSIHPILLPLRAGIYNGISGALSNFYRIARQIRPDVLYIPTGDAIAQTAGMARMAGLSPLPAGLYSECLINRLAFAYPEYGMGRLKRELLLRSLRKSPFSTFHLTDPAAYEWIRKFDRSLASRVRIIPDPVDDFASLSRGEARAALELPTDGRYIVCAGVITSRKGIGQLLDAFGSAQLAETDRLLLAGPIDGPTLDLLARPRCASLRSADRLLVINRVMRSAEIAQALSAADVVACLYPRQPLSISMALQALSRERPVLGSDAFWPGRMIPQFGMGWTVAVDDAAALAAALAKSLDASADWRINDAARRWVRFSSVENFQACWLAGLRQIMGLSPAPDLLTWEWVVGGSPPMIAPQEAGGYARVDR